MNYKKTLQMPKTNFPMRGNLPVKEPERQAKWEEDKLYEQVQKKNAGKPRYVLHDGPIYANGDIHIGHAMNRVLKDIIVRSRSMSGFHTPYVPGWDVHGLPIETALTKSKKIDRKNLSIAEFRELCKAYAEEQIDSQREQFKRLSQFGDWENPYITMAPQFEANQVKVFGEMAKKGYVYQGKKPVYWSPSSESALAEAEIEYHDKRSPSIYVTFAVTDGKNILENGDQIVIWTTTPWTLPANLGIAVHPEFEYVVIVHDQQRYLIASERYEDFTAELEWGEPEVVARIKGEELENIVAKHPLYERDSLVMTGDHVTLDAGTGCVHTAPGHGDEDFVIGKQYGLEPLSPVDDKGIMTDEAGDFIAGMFYDKANKPITEALEAKGALLKLAFVTHSYPHDWRTKKPVIFRATKQWFVSIDGMRDQLLEAIENVSWLPNWGETRLHNMVRDRGDWCISRQRAWGVPIPVFYGEDGTAILEDKTIDHVAHLFRKHGSNVWFDWDTEDLLPEGFTSPHSPNGTFTREMDIMDVWFDSGSSHAGVLAERDELTFPADLYLEGSDQYRGWFNSSLTTSVAVEGIAPYKMVVSHGFVLDGKGQKMSKSLGNVIAPNKVMKQLGADILRLWVASVDYQADVRISDEILKQVAENYRKIRNTFRFLLGNLHDFDPKRDRVSMNDLQEIDLYMLQRLNDVISRAKQGYDEYSFGTTYQAVHHFCTMDLSAFYMDVAKDTLYCDHADDPKRRSMQTAMYDMLVALTKVMAPILPHTTDECWEFIPGTDVAYVQLNNFPSLVTVEDTKDREARWERLLSIRNDVLKALEEARTSKVIGKSLEAKVNLRVGKADLRLLDSMEGLEKLFIVSEVELEHAADEGTEDVQASVEPAMGETCERCWHVKTDVGADPAHPSICKRCADVASTYDLTDLEA